MSDLRKKEMKKGVKATLIRINSMCEIILSGMQELDDEIDVHAILSISYSPKSDTFYIFVKCKYTGQKLEETIKHLYQLNKVDYEDISSDIVHNKYVIEIMHNQKDIIQANAEEELDYSAIINDYVYFGYN